VNAGDFFDKVSGAFEIGTPAGDVPSFMITTGEA